MDQLGVEPMGASKAVPDFLYRGIHAVGHRVILPTPSEMGCRVALIIQLR
jgi:hypothetical protein